MQQAANQGQDPSRRSSQEQDKTGPETRLELQHRSERSNQKTGLESDCLQPRSKVPPRSTAMDRAETGAPTTQLRKEQAA